VSSVVADYARKRSSQKRDAPLVSINDMLDNRSNIRHVDLLTADEDDSPDRTLTERLTIGKLRELLSTTLKGPTAGRDSLTFQLHVIGELTAKEIAELPNFKMTIYAVEAVLRRTRERVRAVLESPDTLDR